MDRALERLWAEVVPATGTYHVGQTDGLPEPARRFLRHAIQDGAPLATAVRLRMHGEIKLKGWAPFRAEQVISLHGGFVWAARASMGLPIVGYDRLLGPNGEMNWRLLGLIPVMTASDPDLSRAAAGRMAGELCWAPSALLAEGVRWGEPQGEWQPVSVETRLGPVRIHLSIEPSGTLRACRIERWGNPDGAGYRTLDFGVVFRAERTFGPFTIGSDLSAGWGYPENPDGEFFRAVIDHAEFR